MSTASPAFDRCRRQGGSFAEHYKVRLRPSRRASERCSHLIPHHRCALANRPCVGRCSSTTNETMANEFRVEEDTLGDVQKGQGSYYGIGGGTKSRSYPFWLEHRNGPRPDRSWTLGCLTLPCYDPQC